MSKKNKSLIKLEREFDYYHRKTEEMEQEREHDRSWESKALIKNYKKIKLALKTQIEEYKKQLGI
jgi:hypothetical protein